MNYLDTALEWHHAGFNVIPTAQNKRPAVVSWKQWQSVAQTEDEVRSIFAKDSEGIALICGFNSVEVIDIDIKADPDGKIVEDVNAMLKQEPYNLIKDYAYQTTPSGGAHLIYRLTNEPPGNNPSLAVKNGKAIIETRGSGGYALIDPTPGYKMYRPSKLRESVLMPEEREYLMGMCADFSVDEQKNFREAQPKVNDGTRPGDQFNRDHGRDEVIALLESHGWTVAHNGTNQVHMVRPGKELRDGYSGNWDDRHQKFYCHTSNALPLQGGVAYSPFALYVALEHGGDWSAAARALAPITQTQASEKLTVEQRIQTQPADRWAGAFVYNPYEDVGDTEEWVINYESQSKQYEFLARGMMLSLAGMEKSRKSRFLYTLAAGGLTGKPYLGFRWLQSPRKILIFDTEQPVFWLRRAGRYLTRIVGNKDWADVLEFHSVRPFTDKERLAYIEEKIYLARANGIVDFIAIDGIVDLTSDFNDLAKSTEVFNRLLALQEDSIITSVIHLNKGLNNQTEQGHLGRIATKKADSILRLKYNEEDNGSTNVQCYRSRTIPFPSFDFTQDQYGNVVMADSMKMFNEFTNL